MAFWSDKRVVVTGGEGFLGSHVVQRLREAGCAQIFVVRHGEYDLATEAGCDRLFHDLAQGRAGWPLRPGLPALDIVVHLAGRVGSISANKTFPADFFYKNLMMGVLTMDRAHRAGAQKFVAASAGCGYPEHAPIPTPESAYWEGFPQPDSAPYSLAKRMLHVQALAYHRQHGFPAVITIPGNIYGPHDNFDLEAAHVIPALVRKFVEAAGGPGADRPHAERVVVWGSGRPTRDFVYAGDVADGLLRAAEVYDGPTLVNLSSGEEHTIRSVVELLVEITGFRGEVVWDSSRPDGQVRRCFDISQARRDLGFAPRTDLRTGLSLTVDWYRRNADRARR